jgi:hypothetical protein
MPSRCLRNWRILRPSTVMTREAADVSRQQSEKKKSELADPRKAASELMRKWRLTCKCSSRFSWLSAYSCCARCPRAPRVRHGVLIGRMVARIAATIRGNNAGQILQSIPIAPATNGTAAMEGTRASASDRAGLIACHSFTQLARRRLRDKRPSR